MLAQVGFSPDFQTRVFALFTLFNQARERIVALAPQLVNHPQVTSQPALVGLLSDFLTGNAELTTLLSDPRVAALKGKMISTGSGGTAFEEGRLASWFLWFANDFGLASAKVSLNQWLDADKADVVNTLWVYGLDLDEEIKLEDGYCITPATQLPDSTDKEEALLFRMTTRGTLVRFPTVAITRICQVQKSFSAEGPLDPDRDAEFWKARQKLYDIAIVLNVLAGVSCLPASATVYALATHPYGPFSGQGAQMFSYDVVGKRQTKLTQEHRADILTALHNFNRLAATDQQRFRRILSRLSQGKRRSEIEEKIMDLGIALEMLLLKDNRNYDQLSLTFRLRGSWLISGTTAERRENYKLLKDLYNHRSQVAHSGLLEGGDTKKIEEVRKQFPKYEALAEKICKRLLSKPTIDWDGLLLGDITSGT
jgi:hypothetical protein